MCSPTDVEAVLARLPRRGVPVILREVREGITKPYSFSGIQKIVHTMRDKSQQAYEGYAKRTMGRAPSATRKRRAHGRASAARTNIQDEPRNDIQNAGSTGRERATK